ncbi:hypothetical protein BLA60_15100 [Actinophytocola xinjiangensis]|uniref:DUF1876 domain-containing protein n=1 Tax=Actinophytocola xinjiangensis TaxID=485602 RepID=A0A7Z0WLW8_9PSEU|nr:DUF1876 domain-containing protein [Actinophytocola xinjiangensis]OLF10513.1 hypothetical protein BLA60_15100 [Actinophytocola xinjiangensis]
MSTAKRWTINISIDEHEARTRATARLDNQDRTGLTGVGLARLNPADANVPEIGDELAVARALADLAHQLLDTTSADIEEITSRTAHLTH